MKALKIIGLLLLTTLSVTTLDAQERKSNSEQSATVAKNVNVQEFDKLIKEKSPVILDVRTPKEFAQGHVDGAININVYDKDFVQQVAKFKKENTIVIYCKSGGRSASAMATLKKEGYQELYNLLGGFNAYSKKR